MLACWDHGHSPVGQPRSFPPLPKPLWTAPDRKMGNGASTVSGPTMSGRDFRNVSVRSGAEGLADNAWRSSAVFSSVTVMVDWRDEAWDGVMWITIHRVESVTRRSPPSDSDLILHPSNMSPGPLPTTAQTYTQPYSNYPQAYSQYPAAQQYPSVNYASQPVQAAVYPPFQVPYSRKDPTSWIDALSPQELSAVDPEVASRAMNRFISSELKHEGFDAAEPATLSRLEADVVHCGFLHLSELSRHSHSCQKKPLPSHSGIAPQDSRLRESGQQDCSTSWRYVRNISRMWTGYGELAINIRTFQVEASRYAGMILLPVAPL